MARLIDGQGRELVSHAQALAQHLAEDPVFRAEWERTALPRAVALQLIKYRTEHQLSQRAMARQLGIHQPALARLEAAEHMPTIETLERLARVLGLTFHLEVTPEQGARLQEVAA